MLNAGEKKEDPAASSSECCIIIITTLVAVHVSCRHTEHAKLAKIDRSRWATALYETLASSTQFCRIEASEMGNTIWVHIQRGAAIECNQYDHSIMCRMDRELDRVARQHGVTLISEFYDGSDMAAEFFDLNEDDAEVSLREPAWYDSASGLKTIQVLLDHIHKHSDSFPFPDDSSRAHWRSDLIEELEDCESLLTNAVADGLPFHFAIIM